MKHAYRADCDCARCARERARRQAQADTAPPRPAPRRRYAPTGRTRKPVWGTQEWAETRGDDIPGGDD